MDSSKPARDPVRTSGDSGCNCESEPDAVTGQIVRWIREARAGSPTAFGRALEASRKYLLLVANRAVPDGLRAKLGASDLVQDTFVEAHRDFPKFEGNSEEQFFAWLTAILVNRLKNSLRHWNSLKNDYKREFSASDFEALLAQLKDANATPGATAVAHDEKQRLQQALQQLSEPMRDILLARTWRQMSFAVIGQQRGCSADAARKTWARAVQQLQRVLESMSED